MVEDTSLLLGLAGLAVVAVDGDITAPVVHLVTTDERARCCPDCGTRSRRTKDRRVTRPRDLPVGGRRPQLVWRKRRWHCDAASCPRRSFKEAVADIPPRKRLTGRLRAAAGAAVADGGRTVVQSARDHDMSWPVVAAAFTTRATGVLPDQPDPVTVLGIDEIRRGRAHWVQDDDGCWKTTVDRWHVGFVDLSDGQGLLGQVEGRNAQVVADWLAQRPAEWRAQIAYVALDGQVRFALVDALLRRTTSFDEVADAALAVARMTNAYTADSDWGPLLARAFPEGSVNAQGLSEAQRRFLAAIVDNDECWGSIANHMMWFRKVGLPADRDELRALLTGSSGAATTG